MKRTCTIVAATVFIVASVNGLNSANGQREGIASAGMRLPGARAVIDAGRYPSIQAAIDALPEEGGVVHLLSVRQDPC